jgi:O-methyltransferase/aklanonic acid methyltransferase
MDLTTALFDELAPAYDDVLPFFAEHGRALIDWADPAPGTRVLDVGAGRGAVAAAVAARGCVVTAVDAAPAMTARLAAEHPGIATGVMLADRLAFADGSFDLVTAGFVVHLVADAAAVLAELRRVLSPGGTLVVSVPAPAQPPSPWAFLWPMLEEYERYLPIQPGRVGEPLDIPALLAGAGLEQATRTTAAVALPVADAATFWRWTRTHGLRPFLDFLPDVARAELRGRVDARMSTMDPIVLDWPAALWRARAAG